MTHIPCDAMVNQMRRDHSSVMAFRLNAAALFSCEYSHKCMLGHMLICLLSCKRSQKSPPRTVVQWGKKAEPSKTVEQGRKGKVCIIGDFGNYTNQRAQQQSENRAQNLQELAEETLTLLIEKRTTVERSMPPTVCRCTSWGTRRAISEKKTSN